MEAIPSMHFDFSDYENAFKTWEDNKELYENEMQLVVSHHEYTSGYWIEKKGVSCENPKDFLYNYDDVPAYIERVRKQVAKGRFPETIL